MYAFAFTGVPVLPSTSFSSAEPRNHGSTTAPDDSTWTETGRTTVPPGGNDTTPGTLIVTPPVAACGATVAVQSPPPPPASEIPTIAPSTPTPRLRLTSGSESED